MWDRLCSFFHTLSYIDFSVTVFTTRSIKLAAYKRLIEGINWLLKGNTNGEPTRGAKLSS